MLTYFMMIKKKAHLNIISEHTFIIHEEYFAVATVVERIIENILCTKKTLRTNIYIYLRNVYGVAYINVIALIHIIIYHRSKIRLYQYLL